jgi:crotonobetainyl-CoA:carnitine CoA-transferase CaiB-like acyl-CoA transferase
MTLPLDGVRVVDFTRVLAGPHCTKHLLDLGAEVIKIEPPQGDITRLAFPRQDDISGYYAQQNAGKRNLSIDLNVPEAREVVLELCDTADLIVENFRPGALAAFGLDYDSVAARNPAVVYVSISGYGQEGQWRTRMAYAPTIQAEAGFTRNTLRQFGVEGSDRRSDSLSHADVYAGLHAAIAALAALQRRRITGRGQYVDVAMAAVLMSINERIHYDLSEDDIGAEAPILGATDCPFFISPDGIEFVAPMSLVGSLSFPFYLHAMRRPDLADDPRFLTPELRKEHLDALHAIVQDWIYSFDSMESVDAQFDEAKIATGRLRDVKEFNDTEWAKTWVTTRDVSDRHGGAITIPAPPWHFSDHDGSLTDQLPAYQGEHNQEILKELHRTDDDINALRRSGALISSPTADYSQPGDDDGQE